MEIVKKASYCVNLSIQEVKDILNEHKTETPEYKNYCEKVEMQISDKLFVLKQELKILENYVGCGYEWHFQSGILQILKLCFSDVDKQKIKTALNNLPPH